MALLDLQGPAPREHERGGTHSQRSSVSVRLPTPQRPGRVEERQAASGIALQFGTSPAMRRVQGLVEHSARSDVPVLITGEVGVGKDLIAREIHRRSSRCDKPLLEVHCASLAGAYFDNGSPVEGGTLFLDDLGELSSALQGRLLDRLRRSDVLQSGSEAARPVELRLIASAQRNLALAVSAGTFSESLYYRLNVIHIEVPPLRTRPEDIPALLRHFAQKHHWEGEFPAELLARFRAYPWPGNARELESAVLRFIALRDPAYVLEELGGQSVSVQCAHCRTSPTPDLGSQATASSPPTRDIGAAQSLDLKEIGRKASDSAERQAIIEMLRSTLGSKKKAAARLGISYKALLYKIHGFGIAESRAATKRLASV